MTKQNVRFVNKDKEIHQRVLTLSGLENSLNADALAAFLIQQVMTIAGQDPTKLHYHIGDGSATNGAGNVIMENVFRNCKPVICASHTSNLSGKLFENSAKDAQKFMETLSYALTISGVVRREMAIAVGTKAEKLHAIRWGAGERMAEQLSDHLANVAALIRRREMGSDSLMDSLLTILDRPANGLNPSGENCLRLDFAIIKDTGRRIADFTNAYEGDGFLAPHAYDAWNEVRDHLQNVIGANGNPPLVPTVRIVAQSIAPNDIVEQNRLVALAVAKAVIVAQKMERDSVTRFRDTLNLFEASRNLNFRFVKDNTIEALNVAIESVQFIPLAVPIFNQLKAELNAYKKIADKCDREMDTWVFWRTYYLALPIWYKVAADVALIMVSSAGVERVFSLLTTMFDKQQERALNDYKEAAVRIRYNENFRNKNFGY